MKKSELKEMIKARVKGLMEAGKEVVITTQDGTAKTASSTEKLRAKQASDNDDVVTYQKRGATNESTNKKSMNKEFLKMQKLAGLITEGQFQKKMEEVKIIKPNSLAMGVLWRLATPEDNVSSKYVWIKDNVIEVLTRLYKSLGEKDDNTINDVISNTMYEMSPEDYNIEGTVQEFLQGFKEEYSKFGL
jgi:hypothetical protein